MELDIWECCLLCAVLTAVRHCNVSHREVRHCRVSVIGVRHCVSHESVRGPFELGQQHREA
jgi:hypothetical protein